MKVLMINSVCGIKSTGRVCTDIAELLEKEGNECRIAYGRDDVPEKYKSISIRIGTDLGVKLHGVLTRLFDRHGYGSKCATRRLVKQIKEYDPDIIHLHNLHGYYINLKTLFDYLKKSGKQVVWSMHDCWVFTGHCAHFDYNGCNKWQSGCGSCEHINEYPKSYTDNSKKNYALKKKLYTSLDKLTVIAASEWGKRMARGSFLGASDIRVFPCGIDLNRFQRAESDFREKNGLTDKFIVIAVASTWEKMKGLEYINRLADTLPEDKYAVVAVGGASADAEFSSRVIRIGNTNSIQELCELYSVADVFVNPTLQENQGLTSVEALACGTPVVLFASGGAPESIDESCGIAVERGDFEALAEAVKKVCSDKPFSSQACIARSRKYDKLTCYQKILDLYKELLGEKND